MNMMNVAKQFWSNSRSCGIVEALRRAAGDLKLISSYRSLDIYLRDLSTLPRGGSEVKFPMVLSQDPHLEVREVFSNQIHPLSSTAGLPAKKYIQKKYGRRSRMFVVFDAAQTAIASMWINEQSAYMPHIKRPYIQLPAKTVYAHSFGVDTAYRNRGIGTLLHQAVLNLMWSQGYHQSLLATYVKNSKASRWNLANGYEKWGRVFYFEWRGKARRCNQLTRAGRRNPNLLH